MQFQIDSVTADNLKAMMNITTADLQTMTFKNLVKHREVAIV